MENSLRIAEQLQPNYIEYDYEAIVKGNGKRKADTEVPCITIDSDSDDAAQDANFEEVPNGPIITVVQYSSQPSSSSKAEQGINSSQFNSRSNPDNQTNVKADKVVNQQANHLQAKYDCPVDGCNWSFKRKSYLSQHRLTHTRERSFSCPECDKSFNRKDTLTIHLRVHRNDKCYKCTWPQCTYSSAHRGDVISHIRTVHFLLPRSKKQQADEEIIDDRDPRDYLARD